MKLDQLRSQWEKNTIHTWEFPIDDTMIFTLSQHSDFNYQLLRYFSIGDSWNVSCDKKSQDLEHCLQEMSEKMKTILHL